LPIAAITLHCDAPGMQAFSEATANGLRCRTIVRNVISFCESRLPMNRYAILALLACTALGGCFLVKSTKSYLGHDVAEIVRDYGIPLNAFDLPNGQREFQWAIGWGYQSATYADTLERVTSRGDRAWTASNVPIAGGRPITGDCVFTLVGIWSESVHSWKVTAVRGPTMIRDECTQPILARR
jgi:hypothetical protein